jgi:transposase InsO family protein
MLLERYLFVKEHSHQFSVNLLCQVIEVSVSSYYAWRKRPESKRKEENQQIVEEMKVIHKRSRNTYGSPRMYIELKKQNISCSENRVARLMKLHQIAAKRKRKFVVTTDSKHDLPVAENILNQDFQATQANEKWVTDITYIHTKEGWLYLAVVLETVLKY